MQSEHGLNLSLVACVFADGVISETTLASFAFASEVVGAVGMEPAASDFSSSVSAFSSPVSSFSSPVSSFIRLGSAFAECKGDTAAIGLCWPLVVGVVAGDLEVSSTGEVAGLSLAAVSSELESAGDDASGSSCVQSCQQ